MTTSPSPVQQPTPEASQARTPAGTAYADAARDHLWGHFTRHSVYEPTASGGLGAKVPVIVRGQGHKIWDDRGRE